MLYGPDGRQISTRTTGQPPVRSFWQAFEGAKQGGYRGWWFFPTLDTSAQMPQFTREQISKKANWCYNNMGAAKAIIDGLSLDEVDTAIWPKATTSNPAFNTAVTNRFHQENEDARTFDLRKCDNFYGAQFLIRRSIRLHGGLFGQLVRPISEKAPPSIAFVPYYQCYSAQSEGAWRDGILFDPETDAPVKYRFAKKPVTTTIAAGDYVDVPEPDVLHFHDPFWPDQIRGISALAPVVRKMFSMDDIERAETTGQIMRSRIAYAVSKHSSDADDTPALIPGAKQTETTTNQDGTRIVTQKIITYDGTEADVLTPPAGHDLKVVESNRGGATDFHAFLARDVAFSTLYPVEYVFFLAGVLGTATRMLQQRAQRVITFHRSTQLVPQFGRRWYMFWLWQRIKSGIFDGVPGGVPTDWFLHRWLSPASMSVDIGREGRLYDDRVMRGNMSPQAYHALAGEDSDDVDDETIAAIVSRKKKLAAAIVENPDIELSYSEIWVPPAGSPAASGAEPSGDDPQPPPKPGDGNKEPDEDDQED